MHLTIKERVELVLMSGADGVCYYYLNCFICFGALFMAQNVCYYYLNCFVCFGALFMAHPVQSRTATNSKSLLFSIVAQSFATSSEYKKSIIVVCNSRCVVKGWSSVSEWCGRLTD